MAQRSYLDFDLLIEPEDDAYRARVVRSPVGETEPVAATVPFSDLELENFLLRVGRPRRQLTRGEGTPEAAAVKDFGGKLFDAFFRDRVRAALIRSLDQVEGQEDTGLRVRLRLAGSPELAELPWEYLYNTDTRRFVALDQWTPLVRYLELDRRIRPLAVEPPLRILMMAAGPTDFPTLDATTEWHKVREALADLEEAGRVQLDRVPTGTLADLRSTLRTGKYHVFHFIGHGRFDEAAGDGVLALEGPGGRAQVVSGTDLGAMLAGQRSLRLVVLNSCEGARGGLNDPYSGTAQSIVYQGIPAVVAMQFEITDTAAITFTHSLYDVVADGYPLDAAMAEARNAVRDEANPVEWATPVLYLRAPDGRIFDVPPELRTGEFRTLRPPAPVPPPPPEPEPEPGPGPTPVPPEPSPGHRDEPPPRNWWSRHRIVAALVGVAVLAGGGVGSYLLIADGSETPSPPTSSPSPSTEPPQPALPQGAPLPDTTLVVPRIVGGNTDLHLQDTGGSGRLLTTAPEIDEGPVISPDRTTILYQQKSTVDGPYELRVMASDGSDDRPLPIQDCPSPSRPAWNPDDPTQLAVPCRSEDGVELRIVRLDGTTVRVLETGVPYVDDPTFSRDGTRIAFWGTEERTDDGYLYVVPADDSGSAQRLTEDAGNADPVFSHDDSEIAYRHRNADGTSHIVVMAADGSAPEVLTSRGWTDHDPTWSPDGTMIAFKSNREGELPDAQIWIMDRSGDDLQQLTPAEGIATHAPAWTRR
jgi:Tol biopolymer transport system component